MLKVKKITNQQKNVENFNEYFIDIAENVKRQNKNNFINDDTMDSHTRFMEQAFTNPYPRMEWKCTTTEEIE
jgi:predicted RNA-binding protein associated with RNAse of E/G family